MTPRTRKLLLRIFGLAAFLFMAAFVAGLVYVAIVAYLTIMAD